MSIHTERMAACSASAAHGASDYVWSTEATQLYIDELKNDENLWNTKFEKFKKIRYKKEV